ncbi:hypothetical protein [Mycobacterium sp. M26]|uniref:YncE family protein n=1 Tax=Mycobacterium sp. M26 TaxID=1762962 RepID=UPI00073EAF15|nr:hypothetical protein [Mycobacterium sp. M26]
MPAPSPPATSFLDGVVLAVRDLERKLFGISVIGSTTIAGNPISRVLTADGSRAVVTTDSAVAVVDPRTEGQVGRTLSISGAGDPETKLTADGSRAVVTARGAENATTSLAVLDTVTGRQVGQTLSLAGKPLATVLTADGSRAVVTTGLDAELPAGNYGIPSYPYTASTHVTVIDTATGRQVGDTLTVAGLGSLSITPNSSRAVVTNRVFDPAHYGYSPTGVVVVDTATGKQVGTPFTFDGAGYHPDFDQFRVCTLSPDGSRAVLIGAADDPASAGHSTARVAVLDVTTGSQVGGTFSLGNFVGIPSGATVFSADGARAIVALGGSVAVVDTATGDQVADPIALAGSGAETVTTAVLTPDGSRAVAQVRVNDPNTNTWSSRVAVIDAATGRQVGTTLTVPGSGGPTGATFISADGSRAVVAPGNYDGGEGGVGYVVPVMVLDTATGQQIGHTVTVPGDVRLTALNSDGSRVVVVTHSHAAVIDTSNGQLVGDVLTGNNLSAVLTTDGSRAVVTANQHDFVGVTSWVAVLDTATGRQVGSTVNLPSDSTSFSMVVTAAGSRAVISAYTIESSHRNDTMRVVVIDTATGRQVGTTRDITGRVLSGGDVNAPDLFLSPDGTRALIRTVPAAPLAELLQGFLGIAVFIPLLYPVALPVVLLTNFLTGLFSSEQWTVIDTVQGAQIGNPHSLVGLDGSGIGYAPPPAFTPDGSRAVVLATTNWGLPGLGQPSTLVVTLPTA